MGNDEQLPQTREEILEIQRQLKVQYGQLYDELLAVFFQYDPMGINFEVNADEYSPEVRTILPRLRECHSEEDVRRVVQEEFNHWFGDEAGQESRYTAVAAETWQRWQKFRTR
jgi:hypothetical protein